jgi:hypothetical protein
VFRTILEEQVVHSLFPGFPGENVSYRMYKPMLRSLVTEQSVYDIAGGCPMPKCTQIIKYIRINIVFTMNSLFNLGR